ncbi:MAG TPA: UDP-N-acetylmuramoyl-L-alanyl-D-glutamate--2,6-diaminopimelate ligase [Burkholderiaceae bacterium]|jgi:UDP-N-acetylmuramoyl-L-alanyl-D-glutamate--2,6-diaminopimelate ligase
MAVQQLPSVDAALGWLAQRGARALTTDSRRVGAGDAFIAWPGYGVDGRQFVPQAFAAGASACLIEAEGVEAFSFEHDGVAALGHLKARTGVLASGFLGAPSERLNVIAVTGTNGKTSVSWWVAQALAALGQRCGVIGTLGVGEPPSASRPASINFTGMTTPDPITVQAGFKRFADAGFDACAIEATSIGIEEQRLAGSAIRTALFTNFTLDHLDYHGSMDAYWQAKARLFAWPGLRAAVVNIDDAQGAALVATLAGSLDVWTYSTTQPARLRANDIRYDGGGLCFTLVEAEARAEVRTRLIGAYNVANLLATIGGLRASGIALAEAARACTDLTPVPGRMDRVPSAADAPQVVVDYAHTPDALEKALAALHPFARERGGALWCVFGCGGDRDQGKRPRMGALAQRLADRVVLTTDNPRRESPAFILLQIVAGLAGSQERVKVIEDRRAAIGYALRHAEAADVILIAGKGHEDYQDVMGVKHHFSDIEEAQAALAQRAGGSA